MKGKEKIWKMGTLEKNNGHRRSTMRWQNNSSQNTDNKSKTCKTITSNKFNNSYKDKMS